MRKQESAVADTTLDNNSVRALLVCVNGARVRVIGASENAVRLNEEKVDTHTHKLQYNWKGAKGYWNDAHTHKIINQICLPKIAESAALFDCNMQWSWKFIDCIKLQLAA